MRSGALKTEEV